MEKRYLLWLTAAMAASYGLGEMDLLEAQAAQVEHIQRVEVNVSPSGITMLAGLINTELCPSVDTAFSLSAGTCTAGKVVDRLVGNIDFEAVPDGEGGYDYTMGAQLKLPGSLVVSMPE